MHITVSRRGETRACDTGDDKLAGQWIMSEIRRLMKSGVRENVITIRWSDDARQDSAGVA